MFEKQRIKRAKDRIETLKELYNVTHDGKYLIQIEEEHKKIRKLQAKDMERLD